MGPKILYIAGYGRSGSTLLDVLLSRHEHIVGAGELRTLFREASSGTECTCGRRVDHCELWGPIVASVTALSGSTAATLDAKSKVAEGGPILTRHRAAHRIAWAAALDLLLKSTGAKAIVDSSKTPRSAVRRPQLLHAASVADVYVIHLIRKPRSVLTSLERGSNRAIESGVAGGDRFALLRLTFNWTLANVRAARARSRLGGVAIRFEDLVSDPDGTLTDVFRHANLDPGPQIERDMDHGLSGNRARRQGFTQVRRNEGDGGAEISRLARVVTGLLDRWVYERYAPTR